MSSVGILQALLKFEEQKVSDIQLLKWHNRLNF